MRSLHDLQMMALACQGSNKDIKARIKELEREIRQNGG